jgi:aquaporin Z
MKLYITPGSPYARIVRMLILEKGLESRVEIVAAQTRLAGSPYYKINPSGRVPYLVRDDGVGLEESALICAYLDQLDGKPAFDLPAGDEAWEARRLEALARSMVDGLAVWGRELARPEDERSSTIIRHEAERSKRLTDLWETEIDHPYMHGALNLAQITLACGLDSTPAIRIFSGAPGIPKLRDWFERFAARPSFAATAPQRAPSGVGADAQSTADREFVTSRRDRCAKRTVVQGLQRSRTSRPVVGSSRIQQHVSRVRPEAGRSVALRNARTRRQGLPERKRFRRSGCAERVVFEHLSGHHFQMTITFAAQGDKTLGRMAPGVRHGSRTGAHRQDRRRGERTEPGSACCGSAQRGIKLHRRSPKRRCDQPAISNQAKGKVMGAKLLAEFIGTFWLVLGGCGSAVLAAAFPGVGIGLLGVSFAFGLTVLTGAYALGPISGGHFNPAVSVGLWAGGRFPAAQLPFYILAQVAGAIVGAGVLYLIASGKADFSLAAGFASNGYAEHSPGNYSMVAGLITEVVMTFMFLVVILCATHQRAPVGFAGLTIGLALTLIHLISIPVTNTSVNPARSTGPALFVGGWALQQLWLFWIAPIVGAAIAGLTYKAFLEGERLEPPVSGRVQT